VHITPTGAVKTFLFEDNMTKNMITVKCEICNKEFIRDKYDVKKTTVLNGFYNCNKCAVKRRNKSRAYPVGAKTIKRADGYIRIKTERGWVREHVYIVEQYLGRELDDFEVVHHCDGNKLNNDIDNLELMSAYEHTTMHLTKRHDKPRKLKRVRKEKIIIELEHYRQGFKDFIDYAALNMVQMEAAKAYHRSIDRLIVNLGGCSVMKDAADLKAAMERSK